MKHVLLARKYAVAIFELAVQHRQVRPVLDDLDRLAAAFTADEAVFGFFCAPTVPVEEKDRILRDVAPKLEISQECDGLCKIMIANGRMALFPDVVAEFRRMVDEFEGRMDVEVAAARELLPDERQKIQEALARWTKKSVTLHVRVDASLIGGVVARLGNVVVDGSVAGRLTAFAESTK